MPAISDRGVIAPERWYRHDIAASLVGRRALDEARQMKKATPKYGGRWSYYVGSELIPLLTVKQGK